jgi:hypothetical protein
MRRPLILAALAALAALASTAAAAQPAAQPSPPESWSAKDEQASWISDPHVHAFYDLTVQTFARGSGPVDEAAYTRKAFAIFRDFGAARGVPPEKMVDHLKLIPGQVAKMAREDPSFLKSYDAFTVFLFGPQ